MLEFSDTLLTFEGCDYLVFSSLLFLFYFLPITLLLYFISPKQWRNTVLLVLSLIFYAWGEPIYIVLILFTSIADYVIGRLIGKYYGTKKAKVLLLFSLIVSVGLLFFFKYVNFLIMNINGFFSLQLPELQLALPLGISFYTFQTMSYIIDVYRGKVRAQKSFITFAMYVTLFPQLIAGPIVRYDDIEKQLHTRKITLDDFSTGIRIFIIGLAKKVLIANQIGLLWEEIHSQPQTELTVVAAWLGIIAFSFQIYFDFSGYSNMAIGLGRMFGFHFPQNFNYPYTSRSIAEFWRRWHMTLGTWFREYIYIPLGGNRKGKSRTYVNLLIVWMLTGFWHGANWNFLLWGLYFGVLISLERAFLQKRLEQLPRIIQHGYFLFFIAIGWVFFVFEDMSQGWIYLQTMFGFAGQGWIHTDVVYLLMNDLVLLLIACMASIPRRRLEMPKRLEAAIMITLLILSVAYLVGAAYNPFLYFRF